MADKRSFSLYPGESASHQILSASGPMHQLLDKKDFVGLTQSFGSEVIKKPGDSEARISPPIPLPEIAAYGEALIKLAQGYEPQTEISFIDKVSPRPSAKEVEVPVIES